MGRRRSLQQVQRLMAQQVDPATLPQEEQLVVASSLARMLLAPVAVTPKRQRPFCPVWCRSTGRRCRSRVAWNEDTDAPRNGKCRVHGGASTGPRTPEGRARIAASNRRRALAQRQVRELEAQRASALAAYWQAVERHEAVCQRLGPGILRDAVLRLHHQEIARRFEACVALGVDDPRAHDPP